MRITVDIRDDSWFVQLGKASLAVCDDLKIIRYGKYQLGFVDSHWYITTTDEHL